MSSGWNPKHTIKTTNNCTSLSTQQRQSRFNVKQTRKWEFRSPAWGVESLMTSSSSNSSSSNKNATQNQKVNAQDTSAAAGVYSSKRKEGEEEQDMQSEFFDDASTIAPADDAVGVSRDGDEITLNEERRGSAPRDVAVTGG